MHYAFMYMHTYMHVCTMHCMYYDEPPNYFLGAPPPCSPQKLRWWVHNEAGGPKARCPGIIWTFGRFETLALAFWRVFVCINTDAVTAKLDWRISLLIPPPSHLVFLPPPPLLTPYLFNIGMALLKSNHPFSQLPDQKRTDGDVS